MPRDDFPSATIRILEMRAGTRCSNPDCRASTSGPHTDSEKRSNVGVAAHICAASVGGPRYDAAQSSTDRKSIHNAIWLCATCSVLIDRDPGEYDTAKLKDWKNRAENQARMELGKPNDTICSESDKKLLKRLTEINDSIIDYHDDSQAYFYGSGTEVVIVCQEGLKSSSSLVATKLLSLIYEFVMIYRDTNSTFHFSFVCTAITSILQRFPTLSKTSVKEAYNTLGEMVWGSIKCFGPQQVAFSFMQACQVCLLTSDLYPEDVNNLLESFLHLTKQKRDIPTLHQYCTLIKQSFNPDVKRTVYNELAMWQSKYYAGDLIVEMNNKFLL